VADGGPARVERFRRLSESKQSEILSDTGRLPRWLRVKPAYRIWQRSNLWMLHNALDISKGNLTLIALWNGEAGDGPGGTEDMVKRVQDRGATFIHWMHANLSGSQMAGTDPGLRNFRKDDLRTYNGLASKAQNILQVPVQPLMRQGLYFSIGL